MKTAATFYPTDEMTDALTMLGYRTSNVVFPDLMVGCPPWHRDGDDQLPAFVAEVGSTRPGLFILEAVRGLAAPRHEDYFDSLLAELEGHGYHVEWKVLDTAEPYAAEGRRRRMFIIGVRKDRLALFEDNPFEWRSAARPIWWPRGYAPSSMAQRLISGNL